MSSPTDLATITTRILQNDEECVVSFEGRSQYGTRGGGVSACGLAALNCARIILGKEKDGLKGVALLQSMMKRETLEVVAHNLLLYRYDQTHQCIALGHSRDMPPVDEFCTPRC